MNLLQEESKLMEIVRLVGMEALSNEEKLTLEIARSIREDYLFQNAFDKDDAYTPPQIQYGILKSILTVYKEGKAVVSKEDFNFNEFKKLETVKNLQTLKNKKDPEEFKSFQDKAHEEISSLCVGTSAD